MTEPSLRFMEKGRARNHDRGSGGCHANTDSILLGAGFCGLDEVWLHVGISLLALVLFI